MTMKSPGEVIDSPGLLFYQILIMVPSVKTSIMIFAAKRKE
nr:hypothetical protein [uncultured bacterium]